MKWARLRKTKEEGFGGRMEKNHNFDDENEHEGPLPFLQSDSDEEPFSSESD